MFEDLTKPLGPFELWTVAKASGHRLLFVIAVTPVIMVIASVFTLSVMWAFDFIRDSGDFGEGTLVASSVVALVAPPVLWSNLGLVMRLNDRSQRLRHNSITDPLTGVLNRRGFFDLVAALDSDTRRWSVAMIDLDDFKNLNDSYGHDVGDQVLITVARWLTEQAGDAGCVGRLGGDEFAVLMESECPLTDGQNRHHLRLGDLEFSISLGCAEYLLSESPEKALLQADAALYRSKADRSVLRSAARSRAAAVRSARSKAAPVHDGTDGLRRNTGCEKAEIPDLGPVQRRVVDVAKVAFGWLVLGLSVLVVLACVGLAVVVLKFLGIAEAPGDMRTSAIIAGIVGAAIAPPAIAYPIRLAMRIDEVSAALRHASITDPLTGLLNRRGFFESLHRADDDSSRLVIMIDLNDFKTLNDTFGHDLGDRILCRVATWLGQQVGDDGIAARMGGDEFSCVVAPTAPIATCDPVQELRLDTIDFSISIGRCSLVSAQEVDAALACADVDLYSVKEGRRRTPSARLRH